MQQSLDISKCNPLTPAAMNSFQSAASLLKQPANLQNFTVFPLLVSSTSPSIPPSSPSVKNWNHFRKNVSSLVSHKAVKNSHLSFLQADWTEQFFTVMVCYISLNHIFILFPHASFPPESLIRLLFWLFYFEHSRAPWLLSAHMLLNWSTF